MSEPYETALLDAYRLHQLRNDCDAVMNAASAASRAPNVGVVVAANTKVEAKLLRGFVFKPPGDDSFGVITIDSERS